MSGAIIGQRRLTLLILIALALAFTSACGFKLRGQIVLSEALQNIALQGVAENNELAISIRNVIGRAGGQLVGVDAASSVLVIIENRTTRKVLSVDSLGRANAYTLIYKLGFRLDTPAGKLLIKPQSIEQQRQYRFDVNNVLAKGDEEQRIIRVMREDAVTRMLVMLQTQLEKETTADATGDASYNTPLRVNH